LFQFTRNVGVQYYDVQVELVDHLASEIEAEMGADLTLSFDEALHRAYASFGPKGFKHIIRQKENAISLQFRKICWAENKLWFTPRFFSLFLAIGLAAYFLVTYVASSWRFYLIVAAFAVLALYQFAFVDLQKKEAVKKLLVIDFLEAKKWTSLLLDAFILYGSTEAKESLPVGLMVAGIVYFFVSRISTHRIHQQMTKQAEAEYPEAFTG
jgi:hypothetical protein